MSLNTASPISAAIGKPRLFGIPPKMHAIAVHQLTPDSLTISSNLSLKLNQALILNLDCAYHRLINIPVVVVHQESTVSAQGLQQHRLQFSFNLLAEDAKQFTLNLLHLIAGELSTSSAA